MAYVWTTGETITAAKLNATGGGVLKVTDSNNTLDKTWQEISDAGYSILTTYGEQAIQMSCLEENGNYLVSYWNFAWHEPIWFTASSPSDYPVLDVAST